MPRGQISTERDIIAFAHSNTPYKNYKDLPLVSTGCDSYASWDPKFKDLSPVIKSDALAKAIVDILPHKEWRDEHLVITGGEPLLGWQKQYPDLLDHPLMEGLTEITFETNGTQPLSDDFWEYLQKWKGVSKREITFSVSAKLPGSGEKWDEAIKPKIVFEYEQAGYAYLKFVVATEEDLEDALRATEEYRTAGFEGPVYLMPVGGVESVYALNNRRVAEMAMKHGLRYSDRLQVPLFKNEWGT
jgi:7-carboxy-7-deazaguanine synthase